MCLGGFGNGYQGMHVIAYSGIVTILLSWMRTVAGIRDRQPLTRPSFEYPVGLKYQIRSNTSRYLGGSYGDIYHRYSVGAKDGKEAGSPLEYPAGQKYEIKSNTSRYPDEVMGRIVSAKDGLTGWAPFEYPAGLMYGIKSNTSQCPDAVVGNIRHQNSVSAEDVIMA